VRRQLHAGKNYRNTLLASRNGPLVFERGIDEVSIYLPEGSRAGTYEIAVFREELGEPFASATGVAKAEKDKTEMKARLPS
jgi:hypothetical protein